MVHLVSDMDGPGQVHFQQDFNLFAPEIEAGNSIEFVLSPSRQAYVLCLEGSLQVNKVMLEKHEAAEFQLTSETSRLIFHGQRGRRTNQSVAL